MEAGPADCWPARRARAPILWVAALLPGVWAAALAWAGVLPLGAAKQSQPEADFFAR